MLEPLLADIIEWDIPNWSVALDYWKRHTTQRLSSASALEIGSRHGGLSLWAALQGMKVLCTDLQPPGEKARDKHERYGVSERIRYEGVDATAIPYRDEFDVVLFKSVLGGIGQSKQSTGQARAITQMHSSLKWGGELWFAENLIASPFHQFFRRRCIEWGKTWRYVTIREMEEFLSIFSKVTYVTLGFLGAFGRTPHQRAWLGKLDRILIDRLVHKSWRYMILGVAIK